MYRADVNNLTNDEKRFYLGVTETPFKERFGNHTRDFKHFKYRNSTELSKYLWELKDAHISPVMEWSILTKVLSKIQLNFCKLCLSEKFYIINHGMTLIYSIKNLNWLILVYIKVNCYWKVLKRIDTVREMIQWIDVLFLILVVLYLMCQYVAIHSAVYWHTHISEEHLSARASRWFIVKWGDRVRFWKEWVTCIMLFVVLDQ